METTIITFDWALLWPNLGALLAGQISSTEGFSALIVLALWCIFGWALALVIWKAHNARMIINQFRLLIKGVAADQFVKKRRDIVNKAKRLPNGFSELWLDFDRSLVVSKDGRQLYRALDAAYFFNARSLSPGMTENRLLAAVPGFLTAIGVIGTFSGLQLGLSGLDLSDAGMKAAGNEINRLISSAAVAFLTSVWGVLTSVLFNFIEKLVERYVRMDVTRFQHEISLLCPRINPEQSLMRIEEHNQESREALQGLAEKIGGKMQEAVHQVSEGVQLGIKEIMAPAIEQFIRSANDLNQRQTRTSEDTLAKVLDSFMQGISSESTGQRQLSEKLNTELSQSIETLLGQLNTHNESMIQLDDERFHRLSEMIDSLTHKQSTVIDDAVVRTQNSASDFTRQVEDRFQKLADQEEKRITFLTQQLTSLREGLQLFMLSMNKSSEQNMKSSKDILQQGQLLNDAVMRNQTVMEVAATNIEKSSGYLNNVAEKLDALGQSLADVVKLFSGQLKETNLSTERLTQENAQMTAQVGDVVSMVDGLKKEFIKAVDVLKQTSSTANEGIIQFSEHHHQFRETLTQHVASLEQEVSRLLSDYASQVQHQTTERLDEWNNQTRDFATTMRDAVFTISDVVNEIEDALSQRQDRA
ncbi:MAG: anti-phage defense ZorAB system ZorA [Candidatus Magnetomorum sp.]|nr:anti-phage defense ZorAB system ZorA [Candidatus Magnetomorum sp.]